MSNLNGQETLRNRLSRPYRCDRDSRKTFSHSQFARAIAKSKLGSEGIDIPKLSLDRLVGIGSVPLQDVKLAVKELERAVTKNGLKGVIIGSNVNGDELGHKKFKPFWHKAEKLGAAIFIHPTGNTDPRMQAHYQMITVG